jgi:hypothetical protein
MQWNQHYGGTEWDYAYAMVQTNDGGYALAGETNSFGSGGFDFWLVKTDALGTMAWNRTFGGVNDDSAYAIVQTADGGYALAGTTASFGAGRNDFWLVKTDPDGNMEWNKTYGGVGDESVYAMVQTLGAGYALAGSTTSFGAGNFDIWLVGTNSHGEVGGVESGLTWIDLTTNTVTLCRAGSDIYWNYVRVRLWKPR